VFEQAKRKIESLQNKISSLEVQNYQLRESGEQSAVEL